MISAMDIRLAPTTFAGALGEISAFKTVAKSVEGSESTGKCMVATHALVVGSDVGSSEGVPSIVLLIS